MIFFPLWKVNYFSFMESKLFYEIVSMCGTLLTNFAVQIAFYFVYLYFPLSLRKLFMAYIFIYHFTFNYLISFWDRLTTCKLNFISLSSIAFNFSLIKFTFGHSLCIASGSIWCLLIMSLIMSLLEIFEKCLRWFFSSHSCTFLPVSLHLLLFSHTNLL